MTIPQCMDTPLRMACTLVLAGLLYACSSTPLTAPQEAFMALGPVTDSRTAKAEETAPPGDLDADLAAWRARFQENARTLRSLSWNCRVRYRVAGAYTLHLLYRAASDEHGDVRVWEVNRRTEMAQGLTKTHDAPPPGETEFERAATLAALARTYTFPQPGAMERLLQPEQLAETVPGGGYRLRSAEFIIPGDTVELLLSPGTIEARTMEFTAPLEDGPVTGTTKFRKLPDGTFYPATVQLTWGDGSTTAAVENFGFRTQPQRAPVSAPAD